MQNEQILEEARNVYNEMLGLVSKYGKHFEKKPKLKEIIANLQQQEKLFAKKNDFATTFLQNFATSAILPEADFAPKDIETSDDTKCFSITAEFIPDIMEIRDSSGLVYRADIDIREPKVFLDFTLNLNIEYFVTLSIKNASSFTKTGTISNANPKYYKFELLIIIGSLSQDNFKANYKENPQKIRAFVSSEIIRWQEASALAITAYGNWMREGWINFIIGEVNPDDDKMNHRGAFYQDVIGSTSSSLTTSFFEKAAVAIEGVSVAKACEKGIIGAAVGAGLSKALNGGLPGLIIGVVIDIIVNTFLDDFAFFNFDEKALRETIKQQVNGVFNSVNKIVNEEITKTGKIAYFDNMAVVNGDYWDDSQELEQLLLIYSHYKEACKELNSFAVRTNNFKINGENALTYVLKELHSMERAKAEENLVMIAGSKLNYEERDSGNYDFIIELEKFLLLEMGLVPGKIPGMNDFINVLRNSYKQHGSVDGFLSENRPETTRFNTLSFYKHTNAIADWKKLHEFFSANDTLLPYKFSDGYTLEKGYDMEHPFDISFYILFEKRACGIYGYSWCLKPLKVWWQIYHPEKLGSMEDAQGMGEYFFPE